MIKIENPNQAQPPIKPLPTPFTKMQDEIKQSFEEFKTKHNAIALKLDELIARDEERQAEINEIIEFLTFTNRRYRKFFHKKHLKSKFK